MAPLDYMGRYMKDFFDYAIADELHQLAGDTARATGWRCWSGLERSWSD